MISVLIPAYNEERLLPFAIGSVRASFEALSRSDYEMIVCDNNSTDGTAGIAASMGAKVAMPGAFKKKKAAKQWY